MKILVLTIHADPTIHPGAEEGGGTHMYVNEILNLLIYKQVPSLMLTRKASSGRDLFSYGGVNLQRMKIGPERQWDKHNLTAIEGDINKQIEFEIQKHNFKPTLIHSIYWYSGRSAYRLSNQYNVPFIHTVISNGLRKQLSGYEVSKLQVETERKIFDKAAIVISISRQEKNDLEQLYGIDPKKIKVIGRGVDDLFLKSMYDSNGTLNPKPEPNIQR